MLFYVFMGGARMTKKKSCEREKSERWWWKEYITIRFPTECLHACMSVTEWVWGCAVSVNVFISFLFGIFIIFVCFSLLFSLFSPITSSIIIYFFCVYHLNICHKIYICISAFSQKNIFRIRFDPVDAYKNFISPRQKLFGVKQILDSAGRQRMSECAFVVRELFSFLSIFSSIKFMI